MTLSRTLLWLSAAVLVLLASGVLTGNPGLWQPSLPGGCVLLALGLRSVPALRSLAFTVWILAAVAAGMLYPATVLQPGGVNLKNPWLILLVVQSVMFGMGTQMSLTDFRGVTRTPWPVLIGFVSQFLIMPLTGWALTKVFAFPPEIAAGVILIGCCPSGLASNVMSCIARANLPLAVTITACTTVAAPLMTPLMMKLLAGQLVEVSFVKMMMETVRIMMVPLGAAFLHDWLRTAPPGVVRRVHLAALGSVCLLLAYAAGGWAWLEGNVSGAGLEGARLAGYLAAALLAGIVWHFLATRVPALVRGMPAVSMAGIVFFTAVTTASGRDHLLQVGGLLIFAAALHNAAGYMLGYGLARLCRLDTASSRTVAFEVGLQNGGMASGLAGGMGKLSTMGLASAVFSPWMNVSGSLLANWWRRRSAR